MKTCFFIGQQNAPDSLQRTIDNAVEFLVRKNHVTEFIVGHRGCFDRMAIAAVQNAIRQHPDKELTAYLLEPNIDACMDSWLPPLFTHFYCPPDALVVSKRYCREKAQRCMLEQTDYLIAYCPVDRGITTRLFLRAKKLHKKGMITILDLTEWIG